MFKVVDDANASNKAKIKVFGVGGGGGNAVKHMIEKNVSGVEFICANTDAQVLENMGAKVLRLGEELTGGLGAGANPDIGRQAAVEDRERISDMLEGADMVFVAAGMGGGTGTGAAPVISEIAREKGILTVGVVTKPFEFEGMRRMDQANNGIKELRENVDSLITIPNQKLIEVLGGEISFLNAFEAANDVLLDAVQGISDLIIRPGLINLDFADVKTVMSGMGPAMMGIGTASGDDRAIKAAEKAVACPLLEDVSLDGARGILVNVTGGADFGMNEFGLIGDFIQSLAADDAVYVAGMVIDPELQGEVKVTVVATGLGEGVSINRSAIASEMPAGGASTSARRTRSERKSTANDFGDDLSFGSPRRRSKSTSEPNEVVIDRTARVVAGGGEAASRMSEEKSNYLDLPTFLRRQVD